MDERINEINENLKLIEYKDGLLFGTDAYMLSAFLPYKKDSVGVELGSGSGVVSFLALVKGKCKKVYGIEVQEKYASLSIKNAKLNDLEKDFVSINKNVKDVTPLDFEEKIDFVFTNPPYMKSTSGKKNDSNDKTIARHEMLGSIDDFCALTGKILKYGGNMYVVYRPERLTDLFFSLRKNQLEPKELLFISADSKSSPSLVLVNAKKGGKSGLKILPPVQIYKDGTCDYTEQYNEIYAHCKIV